MKRLAIPPLTFKEGTTRAEAISIVKHIAAFFDLEDYAKVEYLPRTVGTKQSGIYTAKVVTRFEDDPSIILKEYEDSQGTPVFYIP